MAAGFNAFDDRTGGDDVDAETHADLLDSLLRRMRT
jgi:hypothetical protein